jgi:hypothetical protein
MRSRSVVPYLALLVLAACGGSDPAATPVVLQNAFTGALTITSANPAGNTNCLTTSPVVITAAGVDVHSVTVARGGCLAFTNNDTASHRPSTIGTPSCPELNSPTLAGGATFTTVPLSGPKGCTWQDALNPPATGGGGGGGGGGGY